MKIRNLLSAFSILPIVAMLAIVGLSGCQKDDEPGIRPTVSATEPLKDATNVAISSNITAEFSQVMDGVTVNASTFTLKAGGTIVPAVVVYDGTTASLDPMEDLSPNTLHTATVTGVRDAKGKDMASEFSWTFTTGTVPDNSAPTVSSTNPVDNATGIARSKVITVVFNEVMDPSTISSASFTLSQGTTPVVGTVTYAGMTATFTPSAPLASGTTYTASITTAATDVAENAMAANTTWSFTTTASASGLSSVDLGSAGNYAILAKTAVNNNPTSAITGHIGLSPAATSYITGFALTNATGFATSTQLTGKVYAADMASPTSENLTTAVENMITAYNDAAGRPSPDFLELATGNIGGLTLAPGLYKWTSTVTMPSDLVISGSSNDVWIFQISGDLSMSSAVNITLSSGAQARNIFWQVAGEVTIGTTAHFEGVILSMTGVTLQTGASMTGRILAQTAVVLDGNALTQPQ